MTTGEQLPRDQTGLINAAHAVASWARARRAAWVERTPAPARAAQPSRVPEAPAGFEPAPVAVPLAAVPQAADRPGLVEPSLSFGTIDENRTSITKLIPRLAAAAALIAGIGFGAKYLLTRPATTAPAPAPAAAPEPAPKPNVVKATGSLKVTSAPPGAQVVVDGKRRGVTPLTLHEMAQGRHTIDIQSADGTIRRTVTVTAGATAVIDEAIYSGWVAVYAPFDVTISESGRALATDESNQIMLRPGSHTLRIRSAMLAYDETRTVEVTPGEVTMVNVTPSKSPLTITASEAAEVWIDGTRAGDTPLAGFPVDLGTHDVVVRRPAGGERHMSVTVTTSPQTINVDFSKPGV